MSSVLYCISSASTLQHFLHHGSTLSPCHIMLHCYVPPPPHHLVQPHPPSLLLLLAQPEVGCRLPLIWVSAIQFSGRYKPGQCRTPPPPISLPFPGHKACRQPHMVLKVPTHTPPPLHRYPPTALSFSVLISKQLTWQWNCSVG